MASLAAALDQSAALSYPNLAADVAAWLYSDSEVAFFKVQDDLHMKLLSLIIVGQKIGEKGLRARMKRAQQMIDDAICTDELRAFAVKWNRDDHNDLAAWSSGALARRDDFTDNAQFLGILRKELRLAKEEADAEDRAADILEAMGSRPSMERMGCKVTSAQVCMSCGRDPAPKTCSGCSVASYCDAECQKKHWKTHKNICSKLKNAEAELYQAKDEEFAKEVCIGKM
eukprot:TRINITY_DN9062_c0_g1_i2.p1 TRINITY_DN9062_c0_g1~~TRINITY_DN9062_c0_g1_i2.p1  ORF type:complete len:228 (+),score=53.91 TRINITY_DN9062_c0_g1_i2:84-767(+)